MTTNQPAPPPVQPPATPPAQKPKPPEYKLPRDYTNLNYMQLLRASQRYMPGLTDWNKYLPDEIAKKQIGYAPTFWQDPQKVARYYNAVQMAPKGWQPPDWLNVQQLTDAYNWFNYRNKGKPWSEWKYLPHNDPGLDYMASMQMPPNEYLLPQDNQAANNTLGQVQVGNAPWGSLSPDARANLLKDPNFDIMKYDAANRDQIMNDPNFDWSKLPWWQKPTHDILSNPVVAGVVQSLPMAAVAGVTTGGIGALGPIAMGAAAGWATSPNLTPWENVNDWLQKVKVTPLMNKAGAAALGALGFPSQMVEQGGGTLAQIYHSLTNPEKYGDISNILGSWEKLKATYQSSRGALEGAALIPDIIGDPLQMATALGQALDALVKGGLTPEKAQEILRANPTAAFDFISDPQHPRLGFGKTWQIGAAKPQQPPEINALMAQTRDAIAGGADPVQLVNENIASYGLTGLERDMMVKMVADPLM
jgi:hypothetical protein